MGKVDWSDSAKEDLSEIHSFIAGDSLVYADSFSEKLIDRTIQLRRFPESGRIVSDFERNDIRELIEGNYRIIYQIDSVGIVVLRVLHSARMIKL